ncbi:MAG: HD domain-containing protein [Treponemataceae bacterium]|nr:HD domain-containing protein [Treponemataceae bacterium]
MLLNNKERLITLLIVVSAIFLLSLALSLLLPAVFETGEITDSIILTSHSYTEPYGSLVQNESKKWFESGNPLQAAQYDGTITNPTSYDITSWQIQFELPEKAYISDSWNGIYSEQNRIQTINPPKDYNLTIPTGGTITYGFIMFAPRTYVPGEVTLNYKQKIEISHAWYYYAILILTIVSGSSLLICIPFIIKVLDLQKKEENARITIEQTLKLFANTIEAKDKYTSGHSARVSFYVKELAHRMGLSKQDQQNIYYMAIIHDVGKIGISDSILSKPDILESNEMDIMRTHAAKGGEILADFGSLPGAASVVRHHHERYDGKGYPDGLKGEEIPLFSRIISVADGYDAMTSDRCYRKKLPMSMVREELIANSGTQYDPKVVKCMLDIMDSGFTPRN